MPSGSPETASVGLEVLEVAPARREGLKEVGVRRRGRPVRVRPARSVREVVARRIEAERREEREDLRAAGLPRALPARLGAERLEDLLGEEGLGALVADGEDREDRRLVRVEEDARRRGRGIGPHDGRGGDRDPALAQHLGERAREIERRVRHGDVARPRPVLPDGAGGDDRVAARVAADADPGPAARRDDLRDEVQERGAERVEARAAPARRGARRPTPGRGRRCRCRRARTRAPGTSAPPARRASRGATWTSSKKETSRRRPSRISLRPLFDERLRPGAEDGERVVVVPAPREPGVAAAHDDEVARQDAVDPDLRVAVEARPEPVGRAEAVEGRRRREELRRRREDERAVRVHGDEEASPRRARATTMPDLRTAHGRVLRDREEALLERRGSRLRGLLLRGRGRRRDREGRAGRHDAREPPGARTLHARILASSRAHGKPPGAPTIRRGAHDRPRGEDDLPLPRRPPRRKRPPGRLRPRGDVRAALDRPGRPPACPRREPRDGPGLRGREGREAHVPRRRLHGRRSRAASTGAGRTRAASSSTR